MPQSDTALSQTLRTRIAAAATEWAELPLLSGVRSGSLDPLVFRHYLEQDFVYLRSYARYYARLAATATSDDEVAHFVALAHGVISVELDHHRRAAEPFGCDFDSVVPSAALTSYLDFYEEFAADRAATLVAMTPCIYGYGVALPLVRERAAGGPYSAWIDIYAGGDYTDLVERHFQMIDSADISLERANAIIDRALDLEVAFWNQLPTKSEVRS